VLCTLKTIVLSKFSTNIVGALHLKAAELQNICRKTIKYNKQGAEHRNIL
jgi:hypothetical protein